MTAGHPEHTPEAVPAPELEPADLNAGNASSHEANSPGLLPPQDGHNGTAADAGVPNLPLDDPSRAAIAATPDTGVAAPVADEQPGGVPEPEAADVPPVVPVVPTQPRRTVRGRIAVMAAATRETARRVWQGQQTLPAGFYVLAYALTFVLAVAAFYVVINALVVQVQVALDDIQYGRPRTTHLDAFVGHDETAGLPTHLIAMNLNQQLVIIELPGGDPAKIRTIAGPYLFGADEHLTPVTMSLHDMDGDGTLDLLLDIRREQLVYLNKDGVFRLPTQEEQKLLHQRSGQ